MLGVEFVCDSGLAQWTKLNLSAFECGILEVEHETSKIEL